MTAPHETVIQVEGLRKSFGEQHVLNGVSLAVNSSETVAVLGRSGTGKSVLLRLLAGLERPDEGSIHVNGQDLVGSSAADLNKIRLTMGFLFQDAALYDSMSVGDNVAFPLEHGGTPEMRERRKSQNTTARVTELLQFVGMADAIDKLPSQISGGMKKRVGLARALARKPSILLFDEPTSALDPITASEIEALIVSLREEQGVASIVVTHDLRGARRIANRLAFLHDGHVVFDGAPDEAAKSSDPFVQQFLRDAEG